ncbi:MAG TPA: hypothetical protein VII99_09950 [Bacteroidia bacterium]
MEKTLNDRAEKIKKVINGTAEKSKETIKEIIVSNNKLMDEALNSNAKVFKSIKEKLGQQEVDDQLTDNLKNTFSKSVELAEDALDSIINSCTRQMELTVDFNTKLVDAIKESNPKNADAFLKLIHDNFEATHKLTINNTREIMDFYNKHTNLALNFNKKFEENVNAQVEALFDLQSKGLNRFTDWASQWWKIGQNEK